MKYDKSNDGAVDTIAADAAEKFKDTPDNQNLIRDEFNANLIKAFGEGKVTLPGRDIILCDWHWTRASRRASTRTDKLLRTWKRHQGVIPGLQEQLHLMINVGPNRSTTLRNFNTKDAMRLKQASKENREKINRADDDVQESLDLLIRTILDPYKSFGAAADAGAIKDGDEESGEATA